MKRWLIVVFASLLAVAMSAPTADAKVRHFTLDGELAGGPPGPEQGILELRIDYLVKHTHGRKKLIPRQVTSLAFLFVPVSCDQGAGPFGSFEPGPGFGELPAIKITKKRFSSTYTATWAGTIQSTVQLSGRKMWQGGTKWRGGGRNPTPGKKFFWKRASGTLDIIDWDHLAPAGPKNCTTNGPRSWSVHQCRVRASDPAYLPLCTQTF
jgi:hypothetical protein